MVSETFGSVYTFCLVCSDDELEFYVCLQESADGLNSSFLSNVLAETNLSKTSM